MTEPEINPEAAFHLFLGVVAAGLAFSLSTFFMGLMWDPLLTVMPEMPALFGSLGLVGSVTLSAGAGTLWVLHFRDHE
jgi:hypothetical protein